MSAATVPQVAVHGPGDVRIDEVPAPQPGPHDAVVRVRACGICGTDLGYVRAGGLPLTGGGGAMRLGHELSGVIEALGSEVHGLAPGQHVVLHPGAERVGNGGPEGGFTTRLLVRGAGHGGRLFPVPPGIPHEVAALAEPLGVGMHAVDRAQVLPRDKVVVVGCGPIGLAAIATLRDRGVADVVALDPSARRRALALTLGAREAIDAARSDAWRALHTLHGEERVQGAAVAGSDVYIEASGAAAVLPRILKHARRGARISVVALHLEETPVRFLVVMMKELSIFGAMEYPEDFGEMLRLIGRWDLSPLVTHRFPLARFPDALAVARDPEQAGKVMIQFDEEEHR